MLNKKNKIMEFFIILIIILAIAGPILSLLFWIFIIKMAVDHVQAFEKDQRKLMNLINQYSAKGKHSDIPPEINQQVISKLMSMKNHMNSMDHLRRQQYETKMSGMISNVTSAGFTNFDPGSYY